MKKIKITRSSSSAHSYQLWQANQTPGAIIYHPSQQSMRLSFPASQRLFFIGKRAKGGKAVIETEYGFEEATIELQPAVESHRSGFLRHLEKQVDFIVESRGKVWEQITLRDESGNGLQAVCDFRELQEPEKKNKRSHSKEITNTLLTLVWSLYWYSRSLVDNHPGNIILPMNGINQLKPMPFLPA